ncbi:hypothetical protein BH11PSE10_BH11PSE10_17140 [soil metagenome]
MPIRINESADPLSDASRQSGTENIVINAQSEAGRVLRLELTRYCRGEVNGRSFLVAGHRGAGKTTMVADALDRVLRSSRNPAKGLMQPLPVFLHGPSLFETDGGANADGLPTLNDASSMAAQARGALTQIILGLHRAVVKEFARAYRSRLVESSDFRGRPAADRAAFAELAAQFEVELMGDPSAARLREFWALAEAMECGVLQDASMTTPADRTNPSRPVDRGSLELVAVNGMCDAYQRISGEMSAQRKTQDAEEQRRETSAGITLKGAELVRPVVSVLSGVAVAGGVIGELHSAVGALAAGFATALASSMFFTHSQSSSSHSSRHTDTTFIPDLSLKTLDRILPTLLQRLRDAGLAPVLVVDELDKVEQLSKRLVAMIHFLKKLLAENIFTCFLTDRGYLEQLRLESRGAYSRSYSYFSHPLLVTFMPADFDGFLDKLLRADVPATPSVDGGSADLLDLEILKWVLRYRSELHALTLTRELSLLRGDTGIVALAPGAVRTLAPYLIAVTFQVAIELQLAQPNVVAWLRLHPERSQSLIDAMYFLSRTWVRGGRAFSFDEGRLELIRYMIRRMNLDAEAEAEALADLAGGSADQVLLPDDRKLLCGILDDLVVLLTQKTDERAVRKCWDDLPRGEWAAHALPTLAVTQAMLLGDKSLLIADDSAGEPRYEWRYRPSGVLRDLPLAVAAGANLAGPAFVTSDALSQAWVDIRRIDATEASLNQLLQSPAMARAGGEVFELLADRLRIMPTTPAWPQVLAAIANLELMRRDTGRRSTAADDTLIVRSFVEMLDANAEAVACCLTLAGFLAGTGEFGEMSMAQQLRRCAALLSEGLQFAQLDSRGIVAAIQTVNERASVLHRGVPAPYETPTLSYGSLEAAVNDAFQLGRSTLGQMQRREKVYLAWLELHARLQQLSHRRPQGPATLEELLAAAISDGPFPIFGLDLETVTLAKWTTALMLALRITPQANTLDSEVPRSVIGPALNQLGAAALEPGQAGWLLDWLGRMTGGSSVTTGEVAPDLRGRLALCVANSDPSPMRAWIKAPHTGVALVVTPEQAELLFARGLLEASGLSFVLAQEREPRTPVVRPTLRDGQLAGPVAEVWVYRLREPGMEKPFLVNPQSADEILEFALPLVQTK